MRLLSSSRILWLFILGAAFIWLAALTIIVIILTRSAPFRYHTVKDLPERPVAIVFGAGVDRKGTLTPMLADRVNAVITLYQEKKIAKVLMTGDNSSADYDEVSNMRRYAVEHGLPTEVITLDYAGFNTYQSCYRAKQIFGVEKATLITQNYHLPRAVYACRTLGIDAVGLGLPDWERYPEKMLPYVVREFGALLKAWTQLNITHPFPKYLGDYEGLN